MAGRKDTLFNIAKQCSYLSDHKQKMGAVLYYKHKVVGSGHNSNSRTHPIQARLDSEKYACPCVGKLHAESAILIPIITHHIDISGAEIYIYREKKDKTLGMARPCTSCMKLIKHCRIRKIHYTTEDGYADEVISYE